MHAHNPAHPIGTCGDCGEEMVYNVPRIGPDGGFVHEATGKLLCGDVAGIPWLTDAINRARMQPPNPPLMAGVS